MLHLRLKHSYLPKAPGLRRDALIRGSQTGATSGLPTRRQFLLGSAGLAAAVGLGLIGAPYLRRRSDGPVSALTGPNGETLHPRRFKNISDLRAYVRAAQKGAITLKVDLPVSFSQWQIKLFSFRGREILWPFEDHEDLTVQCNRASDSSDERITLVTREISDEQLTFHAHTYARDAVTALEPLNRGIFNLAKFREVIREPKIFALPTLPTDGVHGGTTYATSFGSMAFVSKDNIHPVLEYFRTPRVFKSEPGIEALVALANQLGQDCAAFLQQPGHERQIGDRIALHEEDHIHFESYVPAPMQALRRFAFGRGDGRGVTRAEEFVVHLSDSNMAALYSETEAVNHICKESLLRFLHLLLRYVAEQDKGANRTLEDVTADPQFLSGAVWFLAKIEHDKSNASSSTDGFLKTYEKIAARYAKATLDELMSVNQNQLNPLLAELLSCGVEDLAQKSHADILALAKAQGVHESVAELGYWSNLLCWNFFQSHDALIPIMDIRNHNFLNPAYDMLRKSGIDFSSKEALLKTCNSLCALIKNTP